MSTKSSQPLSLVTGSCGFLGTHMIEVLAEAGHRIRATDLASAYAADDRKRGRFPSVLGKHGAEFIPSDLAQPETLAPLVDGVDYVFHIASVFSYSAPWEVLRRINVEGTRALLDHTLARAKGLRRMVVWGAGGIYGLPDPADLPLREDISPPAPHNNYLKSKWYEEYLVMGYGRERGLPYSILRPTTVYGPRAVYGGGQLLMGAAGMKVAAIPRNFTSHIPFIHAQDVCRAALYLADRPEANGQAYNLNDDSMMTNVDFFRYVAELMGHRFVGLPAVPIGRLRPLLKGVAGLMQGVTGAFGVTTPLERDPIDYIGREFTYSNEKLKGTGYRFLYADARDGIRDTLRWYQQEGWI